MFLLRRLLQHLLVPAIVLSGSPSTTRAKVPARIVINAETRNVDPLPGPLHSGATVELVVINPNSFRESYELRLEGVDYHDTNLPDALKGLVAIAPARIDTLPPFIWRAQPVRGGTMEMMVKRPGPALPPALHRPYGQAVLTLQGIDRELKSGRRMAMTTPVTMRLANDLLSARNNAEARRSATREIAEVKRTWLGDQVHQRENGGDKERLDSPMTTEEARKQSAEAGDLLIRFNLQTAGWFDDWDSALAASPAIPFRRGHLGKAVGEAGA